jgi:HrpA-like RNA helicase
LQLLWALGALDNTQKLTPHGQKMASLPLDPVFAHLLLRSVDLRCVSEVMTAVSLLSSDTVFLQPFREEDKKKAGMAHKRFASHDGDLPTMINIFEAWNKANRDPAWASQNYLSQRALKHAVSVRAQLASLLQKIGIDTTVSCLPEKEPFLKCIAGGLFLNVAKRAISHDSLNVNGRNSFNGQSRGPFDNKRSSSLSSAGASFTQQDSSTAPYRTVTGNQPVHIHPTSVLFSTPSGKKLPEYVVYAELLITSKHYMRSVTAIEGSWLAEVAPNFFRKAANASN